MLQRLFKSVFVKRENRHALQTDLTGISAFVEYLLQQVPEHSRTPVLLKKVSDFKSGSPEMQSKQLAALYLFFEQYLIEVLPSRSFTKQKLRSFIHSRYPELEEFPSFHLIFQPHAKQEVLLSREFLNRLLLQAHSLLGATRNNLFSQTLRWLSSIPDKPLMPIPFGISPSPPQTDGEWVDLLRALSKKIHRQLDELLGEKNSKSMFSSAYDELAERYRFLESFPVVVRLLPDKYLDDHKIGLLSQSGVRTLLMDKIKELKRTNTAIAEKNEALEQAHLEISATQASLLEANTALETKVRERTAELTSANELLRAEVVERRRAEAELRNSEMRYRQLVENARDTIYTISPDGRITSLNPAFESVTGWSSEEWLNQPFAGLIHPGDLPMAISVFQKVLKGEKHTPYELRILSKSGAYLVGEFTPTPQYRDGVVVSIMGIGRDVTQRKIVEDALRKSEERFRNLVENINEVYYLSDHRGKIRYASPNMLVGTGYSKEELIDQSYTRFVAREDRRRIVDFYRDHVGKGTLDVMCEFRIRKKNGQTVWVEQATRIVRDDQGEVIEFRNITRDVTERRKAHEALRESEEKYRRIVETAQEGICLLDQESKITFLNRQMEEILGYTVDEVAGKSIFEFMDEEGKAIAKRTLNLRKQGVTEQHEFKFILKNGNEVWTSLSTNPILDDEQNYLGALAMVTDITEKKKAEAKVRLLAHSMESVSEMVSITDLENRFTNVNAAFRKKYGYTEEEILGKNVNLLLSPKNPENFTSAILQQTLQGGWTGEVLNRTKDNVEFPVSLSTSLIRDEHENVIGLVGIAVDITERKLAEEARKRSEEALWESEKKYRQVVESAAEVIYSTDEKGNFTYANAAAVRTTEYPVELLRELNYLDLILPEHRKRVSLIYMRQYLEKKTSSYVEYPYLTRSGKVKWFGQNATLIAEEGNITGFHIIARDITERKKMEEALRRSEEKFRDIVTWAPVGFYQTTPEGTILTLNASLARILGYSSKDQLLLRNIANDVYADQDERDELIRRYENIGSVFNHPVRWKKQDGSVIWIELSAHAVKNKDGSTRYFEGFVSDISVRKMAEERTVALSNLGKRLSAAVTPTQAARIIVEVTDDLFGWDACTFELYDDQEDVVRPIINIDTVEGRRQDIPPRNVGKKPTERARRVIQRGGELILREEPLARQTYGGLAKTSDSVMFGDEHRMSRSILIVPIHQGSNVLGVLSIQSYKERAYDNEDLTTLQMLADHCGGALERMRVEQALRESEERLRLMIEGVSDYAIYTLDEQGKIASWNPGAERITGYATEDILGKHFSYLYSEEDLRAGIPDKMIREAVATGRFEEEGWRMRKDGTKFWASSVMTALRDDNGDLRGFSKVTRDMTERKQLEQQLFQAQKMESIGTLVGGISHDFNNILNNILGFAHQVNKHAENPTKIRRYSEIIRNSATRGSEIATQLLSVSRRKKREQAPVHLANVIDEVINLIAETFPRNISISKEIDEEPFAIQGDASEIYQAILNLCLNARDAMEPREGRPGGGVLSLGAINRIVGKDINAKLLPMTVPAGTPFVELKISDTGAGMPEELKSKIFDPFFTTKERGKGTGLGLSIVYNIVRNHKGAILTDTKEGVGTTFSLFFPAVVTEVMKQELETPGAAARGKNELVLLVDDEVLMQELGKELLEEEGYRVLLANDGVEAVELYRQRSHEIVLTILDLVMPKMDGGQTYVELKKINPKVKAFFCTGYTSDQVITSLLAQENLRALQKPFKPDEFVKMAREVIEQEESEHDS